MVNFNAAPNKKAKLNLETTALKQSRADLNIAFSTADRETGIFEFTITQNNKPLLISENNAKTHITLVHSKGISINESMVITDELNGKVSYQVPNEVLSVPGRVEAQVYVVRKSKNEVKPVVAERIFSFEIEKSLAWKFDGETKLNYIIEFDELEKQIQKRTSNIEEAMKKSEDYVTKIKQAKEEGLSDIDIAKSDSLKELEDMTSNKKNQIDQKGSQYKRELESIRSSVNSKIDQFNRDIEVGDYIGSKDVKNWQKSKLTNDNGYSKTISNIDFMRLGTSIKESGLYYVSNSKNGPTNESNNGYIYANVLNDQNIHLIFTPINSKSQYTIQKINGEWGFLVNETENMETIQGSKNKSDEAYNKAIRYFNNEKSNNYESLWKGTADNKNTMITLKESFKNYKMLIIVYEIVGHVKNSIALTQDLTSIAVHDFNLADSDGSGARLFESVLVVEGDKQLKIRHNHSYTVANNTGVPDVNVVKYKEIVGVK